MSSPRLIHRVATLLAALALLVAPLRSTVACDMGVATHESPPTTDVHAGHHGHVEAPPAPEPSDAGTMPCDDWASCAMIALPPRVAVRALPPSAPGAPRITIAVAPDAPATAVEPPPPRA